MGTTYAATKNSEAEALISTMSSELQGLMAEVDSVTKKSADLQQQILFFEDRQKYINAALEESQKIAGDINSRADRRIKSIQAYADGIVSPQQQEITELDMEIAAIDRELGSRAMAEPSLPPDLIIPELDSDCFIPDKIIQLSDYMELPTLSAMSTPDEDGTTEYESLQPQSIYESSIESTTEAALSVSEFTDIENEPAANAEFCEQAAAESVLSEKQDWASEVIPFSDLLSLTGNTESSAVTEAVWPKTEESPLDLDQLPMEECISQNPSSTPLIETETAVEIRAVTEEQKPQVMEVPNIMYLETPVNAWHEHSSKTWDHQNHNHNWLIKLKVEVPEDSPHIIQAKVLAAVQSTLSRYEDVLLNDVFPFNLIDPSDENVASYFFNCLEDTVMMKDLRLLEIGLWEDEILFMSVTERHAELDEMLKGDDIIERMRANLLAKSQGGEVPADNVGKKKRSLFGRWR